MTASRLGEVLGGFYKLVELVRTEGAVEIYRATHTRTNTEVQVKLLRPEFALQGPVVDNFLRGPRALAKVSHHSLPSVQVDTDDTGIPFVVEEQVQGRPSSELLASFPQGMPLGLATHLLLPLTEALSLAHENGMLHGALDPSRVLLLGDSTAPTPKLMQLGVAKEALGQQDDAYRAPELTASNAASKTGDVFALGVLLYRMLSGELPFGAKKTRLTPLDDVAPQLPSSWVTLAAECLALDPKKRIKDAAVLVERLRACAAERGPSQLRLSPVPALAGRPSPVPAVAARVSPVPKRAAPVSDFANGTTERPPPSAASKSEPSISFEDTAPDPEEVETPKTPASKFAVLDETVPALDETAADFGFDAGDPEPEPPKQEASAAALKADVAKAAPEAEPRSADAEVRTISSLANAFGPLTEEGTKEVDKESSKKPKKSAAKAAAEKLGSKIGSNKVAKPESKPERRTSDEIKVRGAMTAALDKSATKLDAEPAKDDAQKPARPLTKQGQGRSQGQIAAIALTETQLQAMRALRTNNHEARDRWSGLIFMLLFMLLLQLGIPLLYEPKMAAAQAMFGPKLRYFATGFAVTALIATARIWAVQISSGSPVMRVTTYTMQLVTACICVLTASLFSRSPTLNMAVGAARSALPWGASFLFFMFAFAGALRGARDMAQNVMYGALVLMLSTGSLYGSYRAVFSTVLAGKKLSAAQIAAMRQARERNGSELSIEEIKKQASDKTSLSNWQEEHSDTDTMQQRHEVGAGEADDLRATEELDGTRKKNAKSLMELQKALPGSAPE